MVLALDRVKISTSVKLTRQLAQKTQSASIQRAAIHASVNQVSNIEMKDPGIYRGFH